MKQTRHTKEFVETVLQDYSSRGEKTAKQIAEVHSVPLATLYWWVKRAQSKRPSAVIGIGVPHEAKVAAVKKTAAEKKATEDFEDELTRLVGRFTIDRLLKKVS